MTFSNEWDELYKQSAHLSIWPWSDVVSLVMRNCRQDFSSDFRVLELGCGAGANIPFFLSIKLKYYAMEGSPNIVETLKGKYPEIKDNIVVGDFTKTFPFEGKFDLILDRASVTCNSEESIRSTMNNIRTFLKPGGKFIGVDWYSVENTEFGIGEEIDDPYTRIFKEKGEFINTGRVHFFDKNHLESFYEGLRIVNLVHKTNQYYIPDNSGYRFCSWNVVAEKLS
jgi:SAM-dependent methyltransferase